MLVNWDGYKDIVKLLLANGADGNVSDTSGYTALINAAHGPDQTAIVELLIQYNVDVNAKTEYGYTALILAAMYGYKDNVKLLLANGADTNITDYVYGRSAQDWATELNYTEISKLLPESKTVENPKLWQYFLSGCLGIYNGMKQIIPQRFLKLF